MITFMKFRPYPFGVTQAVREIRDGFTYLRAANPLESYPVRLTDKLLYWAKQQPDRTIYARRDAALNGDWRHISFSQALSAARSIGQALLDRGLSVERPLVILSENSLEHAMLALGAMYAGVPFCAVSPPYSLVSHDFDKLKHVWNTLTPGMVYASDWKRYQRAIEAVVPSASQGKSSDVEVVVNNPDSPYTSFSSLLATKATAAVDAAMQATGPDTIVKFLFTSGSTKLPKAVINTQGMLCANQQQMLQSMPVIGLDPLILLDWAPWNHTAGGNHDFFMVMYNGGTLYIDDGKPTPTLIGETLKNLREIAPTWYFNVPIAYEMIVNALQTDAQLRKNFLSRVHQLYYAGAGLSQAIWDQLYAAAELEFGERIVMTSGLGMTETSPFAMFVTTPHSKAGDIGLPAAGLELKLVPMGDKTEIRYRGPNVTTGYWRNPEASAEAFDDEGFFCSGDAVQWIDPENFHLGLQFDGRIAEDFKLSTGTFVSVGPMRAKISGAGAPYVQDAVLTGINLNEIGALIVPTAALRQLSGLGDAASQAEVNQSTPVQQWLANLLKALGSQATGSANRIARCVILDTPLSIDKGEITDKGSVNQRAVLKHRADLVDALHAGKASGMQQL